MEIAEDFKELLELLNAHEVEYVIVGAYALGFHGAPRLTGDLDILIDGSVKNAEKVMQVLTKFGFASLGLTAADLSNPENVIQLGYPPIRIDILSGISGVTWDEVQLGRALGKLGGIKTFFIGRTEFIKNKRASGRPKDLADIDAIGGKQD